MSSNQTIWLCHDAENLKARIMNERLERGDGEFRGSKRNFIHPFRAYQCTTLHSNDPFRAETRWREILVRQTRYDAHVARATSRHLMRFTMPYGRSFAPNAGNAQTSFLAFFGEIRERRDVRIDICDAFSFSFTMNTRMFRRLAKPLFRLRLRQTLFQSDRQETFGIPACQCFSDQRQRTARGAMESES